MRPAPKLRVRSCRELSRRFSGPGWHTLVATPSHNYAPHLDQQQGCPALAPKCSLPQQRQRGGMSGSCIDLSAHGEVMCTIAKALDVYPGAVVQSFGVWILSQLLIVVP